MIIHECLQNSEEWQHLRKGKITASRASKIMTPGGKLSASAKKLAYLLISECFCPDWVDFAGNRFTDRGTEMEPAARDAFRAHTGLTVKEVGFITRDDRVVGCSPDGIIPGDDGEFLAGLEIKCPSPQVHIEYIAEGILPPDYIPQVHTALAVTGLPEWHFWSHFEGMQPFHIIVKPDAYTAQLSAALDDFVLLYSKIRSEVIPKLTLK